LLAGSRSGKETAAAQLVSIGTVEYHLASIYLKIGVHGRVDAAAFALRLVLAQPRTRGLQGFRSYGRSWTYRFQDDRRWRRA
jgi:Bacterial regulatory proteins, luxR family